MATSSKARARSTKTPLWKVSVRTTAEAEDAAAEILGSIFGLPAAVYSDTETKQAEASVFVSAVTPGQVKSVRAAVAGLKVAGLDPGEAKVSCRRIKREDWAESWKRHFKPIEISPRLLLKPSWSRRHPRKGQAVVILDPGLSFGTGQHPTTSFCLEQLDRLRDRARRQALLDVGCGSGILAIAAARLGYSPVEAFDFDPEAVRVARENAAVNGVAIRLARRDLLKVPLNPTRRFDIVCANLMYDLLIAQREKLIRRVAPDGTLLLAGILNEQFPAVEKAFKASGMRLVADASVKEWRSGAFVRR